MRLITASLLALATLSASAQATRPTKTQTLVADFNHDGIPDVLAASPLTNNLILSFGSVPYGTFNSNPAVIATDCGFGSGAPDAFISGQLVVADWNGDGIPDLFSACTSNSGVVTSGVKLGNGDGTFGTATILNAPSTQGGVAGDFNHDGKLDLVLVTYPNGYNPIGTSTGYQTPALLFFAGNGDGTFATPVSSPLGASATFQFLQSSPLNALVAADVDGDGYPDILVSGLYGYDSNAGTATLVLAAFGNRKDGTFGVSSQGTRIPDVTAAAGVNNVSRVSKPIPGHFSTLTALDFIVPFPTAAFNSANAGFYFIQNTSTPGNFSLATGVKTTYPGLLTVSPATFTGSGYTDLAIGTSTTLSALVNDGSATFTPSYSTLSIPVSVSTAFNPSTFTAADANGDGYSDIYTASIFNSTLAVSVSIVTGTASATSVPFALPVGTSSLSATWPGNLNFSGSNATASQTVNGSPVSLGLTSSKNPSNTGDTVNFTATVAPIPANPTLPTGTISILVDNTSIGQGLPSASGTFTAGTSTLAAGSHTVTATFTGDPFYANASAPPITQTVSQAVALPPVLAWSPAPINVGSPLGPPQLNAVATSSTGTVVPGTYAYTPGAGTAFTTPGSQVLSVTFTPADPVTYQVASLSVPVTVLPASRAALTSNLLLNPGAELGLVNGTIPNWTPAGEGAPTLDSGSFDGFTPHTGTYDFLGQNGASDSLSQTVSIVSSAVTTALIDSASVSASLSFWEQGLNQGTPSDDATVSLAFLDVEGDTLSTVTTAEVDSHDGSWKNLTASYPVPAGTRSIVYTMNFIRHAGSDLDAFVDDNSLILTGPAPALASSTTLTVSASDTAVSSVAQGTAVALTVNVLSGGLAAYPGQVVFCDNAAALCTDIHRIGTAQLNIYGTASLTYYPAAGNHTYKAIFLGTSAYLASTSANSSLAVTASYPTTVSVTPTGSAGNYSLTAAVLGSTAPVSPSGTVSFVDQTSSNAILARATLASSTTQLSFGVPTVLPTGSGPIGVLHADLNNDGKPDLIVNNASDNTISIRLGIGDGTFTTLPDLATGRYQSSVAIGDFNADGFRDLAVTNFQDSTVTIFLGNGDGTFSGGPTIASGEDSRTITTADFNRDGRLDLAIGHDSSVTLLLGNGDGTFTPSTNTVTTGNGPNYAIVTGDFDGDGNPDIAVTNTNENTVSILLGNGNGTFITSKTPGTGGTPVALAVGDVDGDGKLDLVTADQADNNVTILLGDGAGKFTVGTQPSVGQNPQGVTLADLDGDGIVDIVTANQNDNTLSILRGLGRGTFTLASSPSVGTAPDRAAIADFNGDGIPDLASSNVSDGGVSVLLTRRITSASASVTGINPIGTGTHQVVATYSGDTLYAAGTSTPASLTATQFSPMLTWTPAIAAIPYGTPLGPQQLNATANDASGVIIPGTYTYTPAAGAVLGAGTQTLTALFTPTSASFTQVRATRSITITQATPTLAWTTPAAITQGTALSATQLNAVATGVTGALLPGTFTYTPAAGTVLAAGTQTLSVLFTPTDAVNYSSNTAAVRLTVNGLALSSLLPNTANLGDAAKTITLTGVGFTNGSVVQVNGTSIATTYVSATSLTAVVPASNFGAVGTLAVTVFNAATATRSQALSLTVSAPAPSITLTGPSTTQPSSQPTLALNIANPYPIPLTASFTLSFASAVTPAVDDPAIQFASGGRTYTFTVPANSTTVPAIQVQAGTVAGTIRIPLTLTAAGVNVTPASIQPVTIVVPGAVPAVTSAAIARSTTSFTVTIHGFSNTREVTTATFHFVPATGSQIDTPDVTIPVTPIFSGWFTFTPSTTYGSTFTYTQVFNVSDTAASVGSVQVTLTNSVGVSTTYTAQ